MRRQDVVEQLRHPTSAAIAGIIFSLILGAVIVQFHAAVPAGDPTTEWLLEAGRRRGVHTAVNLIPFAGIAFLWFIGVIRMQLGQAEDKLFSTVFLGSGLLFIALLFVTGAMLAASLSLYRAGMEVGSDALISVVTLTKTVMGTFGNRMAAVFTISVTSIGLRTGVMPRWLAAVGYAAALALLLSPPITRWSQLLFPAWVLVFSLYVLIAARRRQPTTAGSSG